MNITASTLFGSHAPNNKDNNPPILSANAADSPYASAASGELSQALGFVTAGGSLNRVLAQGITKMADWIAQPVALSEAGDLGAGASLSSALTLNDHDRVNLARKAQAMANVARTAQFLQKTDALPSKDVTTVTRALKKSLAQFQNDLRVTTWLVPLPPTNNTDLDALVGTLQNDDAHEAHDNAQKAQVMADLTGTLSIVEQLAPTQATKLDTTA